MITPEPLSWREAKIDAGSTVATIILGSTSLLIFGLQPLLYRAFVTEGTISSDGLGLLSAAEVLALALGSGIAVPLVRRLSTIVVAVLAVASLAGTNFLHANYGDESSLFIFRVLAGLSGGVLVGIAGTTIAQSNHVARWAAVFMLCQASSQYTLLQWLTIAHPDANSSDLLKALSAFNAAMLCGIPFLPRQLRLASSTGNDAHPSPERPGILCLATMFLFVGGGITIWAYTGVWLEGEAVDGATISKTLSLSLAGQIAGALLACLPRRSGRDGKRFIAVTLMILASTFVWLQHPSSLAAPVMFGFFWMYATPLISGILSDADPDRKALPFAPSVQLAGAAFIPTATGYFLAEQSVELVLIFGCLTIGLSLIPTLIINPTQSKFSKALELPE